MMKLTYSLLAWIPLLLANLSLSSASKSCKATPGSPNWPTPADWANLKNTINGQLLQPGPPGAVCHPKLSAYNATACTNLQTEWQSIFYHQDSPNSVAWNNFNNDSCLPKANTPCSGEGYPVYVVNATTAAHAQAAVRFAGKHGIRLIVKATGHDYLGRSIAPNSLSVWTHHMKGIVVHETFTPKKCSHTINAPALTVQAGSQMRELNVAASKHNLTILSGGGSTVGVVGHMTGGGHSAMSTTYGLAADSVLEVEMVTPTGDIVTANECQHQDLFWAVRGGGGSTFGVVTSLTAAAFPAVPYITLTVQAATAPNTDTYWDAMAYLLSQYPSLSDAGISAYSFLYPNISYQGSTVGAFIAVFSLPKLSTHNSTDSLSAALAPLVQHINTTYPGAFQYTVNATEYPTFYAWWKDNNGPNDAGADTLVGSRLLDRKALSSDLRDLRTALKNATPPGQGLQALMVGGKGVRNAVPRGGSDAVLPAWRDAVVHAITGVSWPPLDAAAKLKQQHLLTNNYVEALRKLAPDTGAYINEADLNEPNPAQTFWGAHYPRLLKIKRKVDPDDVFWCTPCAGNERWKEVGDQLCRV